MSIFTRTYERLLPKARAFFFWQSTSQLRQFFEGLSGLPDDVRAFFDSMWTTTQPAETGELTAWEKQFGLPESGLSEADRRTRLDAAWSALGGQSPRYLQDTLQANGFNVYVHEWWQTPATEPPIARDPRTYLSDSDGAEFVWQCGQLDAGSNPIALCGEDGSNLSAPFDVPLVCGQTNDPVGYVLVNKIRTSETIVIGCSALSDQLECSDRGVFEDPIQNFAYCGQPRSVTFGDFGYSISDDSDQWRYFIYYGGETFPDQAAVDPLRRNEFEDLVLKLSPGQLWLGILVDYTPT